MPQPLSGAAMSPNMSRQNSLRRRSRSYASLPISRSSSRASSSHRSSKIDIYSRASFNASVDHLPQPSNGTSRMMNSSVHGNNVKRWDGNNRTMTKWDSLRRDPELWFPSGDCLVHFYEQGLSRRGPSLRLSLADIESSNCRPLLQRCCAFPVPDSPSSTASNSSSDGGYFTNPSTNGKYELYIPAPIHLSREEAFQYHLTTRNFFAWMFEKPVVGPLLGEALVSLLERMKEFRPDEEENRDDILEYLDVQGYTDFRECPDHALAVLQFSERFQYRDLWTDAFVHCTGMNGILLSSPEFNSVSRMSKALITRAHLEMDLRLEHAGRSLGNFLEDDLAGAYLGLPSEALEHLERFRSFLHSFYVNRHGYWPPTRMNRKNPKLPKSILRSMYFDFRSLYEYLVDPNTYTSLQNSRPGDGGICVLQNVSSFDKRYKYISLPYPLPRVPEASALLLRQKPSAFSRLFGNRQVRNERRMATLGALTAATNSDDIKVMECALVREYFRFEREWTITEEGKLSSAEARKVRWILIYAILQTLISVTRAPTEVRDTEDVSYPLCCQLGGTPPWTVAKKPQTPMEMKTPSLPSSVDTVTELKPDMDYFNHKVTSPVLPPQSFPTIPRPKTPSLNSTSSPQSQNARKKFVEIVVDGYGNGNGKGSGSIPTEVDPDPVTPSSSSETNNSGWSAKESSSDDDLSIMDHTSIGTKTSIYAEDEKEQEKVKSIHVLKPKASFTKGDAGRTEIAYICVRKTYSVESFRPRAEDADGGRYTIS